MNVAQLPNPFALRESYRTASPFPCMVLDNFILDPALNDLPAEIAQIPPHVWAVDDHHHQKYKSWLADITKMPPQTRRLVEFLNSPDFCQWLSILSGIDGLEADPTLLGGGIHRTRRGGKLGIHADFNIHQQTQKHRRLNILLYLNKTWEDDWNGFLELWERDMSKCVSKIKPIWNRAVIFTITDDAFHGHPQPLQGEERLSIALYYYTKDRPEEEKAPFHWAAWQTTP